MTPEVKQGREKNEAGCSRELQPAYPSHVLPNIPHMGWIVKRSYEDGHRLPHAGDANPESHLSDLDRQHEEARPTTRPTEKQQAVPLCPRGTL